MSLTAYIIIFAFSAVTLFILLISLVNYLVLSRMKQFYQALIVSAVTAALMLGSGIMIGVKTCNFVFSQFSKTKTQVENKVKERTEQRMKKINYLLAGVPDNVKIRIPAKVTAHLAMPGCMKAISGKKSFEFIVRNKEQK